MAFLDDISKKLTDVSQATIQKTRNLTDTAKLNSLISDEEKNIRINYSKLGELYYHELKDSAEGDFASIVSLIDDSMARISEYKGKIEEIKTSDKCPNCGATIASDDMYCAGCGAKIERNIPEPRIADGNICKGCGKPLAVGAAFCVYCGTKMEEGN